MKKLVALLATLLLTGVAHAGTVVPLIYYQSGQLYSYWYEAPSINGVSPAVCFTSDLKTAKCSYPLPEGVADVTIRLRKNLISY